MVFPALDPTIREKVISAHLTGKGRNQIARELNEQGFKVSTASVTNFIKGYERQHQETAPNVATTNTAAIINQDVLLPTEEKDSEQQRQSTSTLSDSTYTPITDEEPLLMDWNPDDSYEKIFWRRIMAEKKQRQQELHVIKREREMLEVERRQLAQLKEQPLNGDNNKWLVVDSQGDNYAGY